MWAPEERGQAIAVYSLAPLLGPAIGPVAGGWIAERSTWRWVFWSTSIAAGLVGILGILTLPESECILQNGLFVLTLTSPPYSFRAGFASKEGEQDP